MNEHEILEQAKRIRMDLTALQAKVTELLTMASKLPAPNTDHRTCPECGLHAKALPQGTTLHDHRWQTHTIDSTTTDDHANVPNQR